jgi:hypothetical protein
MGEIRSTLDIIMEKTKGLTMSEEEKRAFKEEEMAGKIKGLIQKFLDKILDMDQLKREVAGLGEKGGDMVKRLLREESVSRIEPEGDNELLLSVLEEVTGSDTDSLREFLKAFAQRLEQEEGGREEALKRTLEKQGISGSAVIPNIQADSEWGKKVSKIRDEFQEKLGLYREQQ